MESATSDWICCWLLDPGRARLVRRPFWIGQVEFSDTPESDERCVAALAKSMDAHAVATSGAGASRLMRARLLIPGVNRQRAQTAALFHLRETVEAFNAHVAIVGPEFKILPAGYVFDIRTRKCQPNLPEPIASGLAFTSFIGDPLVVHPLHVLNTLYAAPEAFGPLGDAFRRSAHWRKLASEADDPGQSLLFYWMAGECLCKTRHDEHIEAKLMAAVGFPCGILLASLDERVRAQLLTVPNYRAWRGFLSKHVGAIRIARNQIVHEGYRHVDLPDLLGDARSAAVQVILPHIAKCLATMALNALAAHVFELDDMWRRYAELLNQSGLAHHASWFIDRLKP